MIVSFAVKGASQVSGNFHKAAMAMQRALQAEVKKGQYMVQREAKLNVTKGRPLNVRSGRLRSSIAVGPLEFKDKTIMGRVGTDVVYGKTHEFGAKIKNGFGRGVLINIPKRPWLEPAFDRTKDRIAKLFSGRVTSELNKAGL